MKKYFIENIRKISSQINNKDKVLMGIAIYNQPISMISKKLFCLDIVVIVRYVYSLIILSEIIILI